MSFPDDRGTIRDPASTDPPFGETGAPPPSSPSPPSRQQESPPATTPRRERRRSRPEQFLIRLIATCGIVGIGVALGAILTSSKIQGWIIGLVVAAVSVPLSAVLWSSRQL